MKTGIKSYECAMKIYMKRMKSHMKRYKYSYDKRVLGDFPLTRRHVYTKCVSCDGHWKPFRIIYGIAELLFDLRQCTTMLGTICYIMYLIKLNILNYNVLMVKKEIYFSRCHEFFVVKKKSARGLIIRKNS